jgi:streptogramin lyase
MKPIASLPVAFSLACLGLIGCDGGDSGDRTAAESTEPAVRAKRSDLDKLGASKVRVDGDWLAASEGGVWLSGTGEIHRMDPQSGKVAETIPVPEGPCEASDVGFGAAWISAHDVSTVWRLPLGD